MLQIVAGLDVLAYFVATLFRHDDVAEDNVRPDGPDLFDCLLPITDSVELEILVREGQLDDLLYSDAIVGEQDLVSHRPS